MEADLRDALVRRQYRFLHGWYVAELIEGDRAVYVRNDSLSHPWLNHVGLVHSDVDSCEQVIDAANAYFSRHARVSSFHLMPDTDARLKSSLFGMGAEDKAKLAWMVLDGRVGETSHEIFVERVHSAEAVRPLFMEVHQSDALPGGTASDYAAAVERFVVNRPNYGDAIHYVAKLDGAAAGYASVCIAEGFAAIQNVGTAPAARKQGVSSAVVARAVADAREAGAHTIYLMADSGSYPERLYSKLGFRTKFTTSLLSMPVRLDQAIYESDPEIRSV